MKATREIRARRSIATWSALLLMAGCAVGPDFERPAAPDVRGYTASPLSTTAATTNIAGGEAQQFLEGRDIPAEWWTLFHSKPLNALIERAFKANPTLQAAQASLRVAQENVYAQRGAYFPFVSANLNSARQSTPPLLASPLASGDAIFSLHTAQVLVSFLPDVFGANRRLVESLEAQAEVQRFQLEAAYITLAANVVAAAVQEGSLRAQIDAIREVIAINSNMLQVVRANYAKGQASRLDVAAQESQLAQVTATLPPLLKQLAQQRDLLAALAGGFPSQGLAEQFELLQLQLPRELPVSLSSRLVEQRPDVRAAEAQLHSASAQIGVAVANMLPQFTITGGIGSITTSFASDPKLFESGTGFWAVAGSVTQPVFQGGTLLHRKRAAEAAFDQAGALYRSTVLTAFQNVADTLNALQHDAEALKAAAAAADSARVTLDLARRQMETGGGSQLNLLIAQITYQQTVINLIQAQANRYADTAALFQALGGGWWNRSEDATAAASMGPDGDRATKQKP